MSEVQSEQWSDPGTGYKVSLRVSESGSGMFTVITETGHDYAAPNVEQEIVSFPETVQEALKNFMNTHPEYIQHIR